MIRHLLKIFVFLPLLVYGQQDAQYSQYMVNNFILNPAVAGTTDGFEVKIGYRSQWAGLKDAPKTIYVTAMGSVSKTNTQSFTKSKSSRITSRYNKNGYHSLGGLMYNDQTGPTSRSGAYLAYAYNLGITSKIRASMGLFAGMQQFRVDGERLLFYSGSDPLMAGGVDIIPDASIGTWIYSPRVYAGFAVKQIFKNKLDFVMADDGAYGFSTLSSHYFFTGGYKINLGRDFTFVPSFLVKVVDPAPVSWDLNSKFKYKNIAWAGLSYRQNDAMVALGGFTLANMIDVAYSYDIITSELRRYASGTHEITIGINMNSRRRVYNPSDFW